MNKLFFSLIAIALIQIGCSSTSKKMASAKMFIPYGYDFTEFANKGFLFTPLELIDRPYEGRGLIRIDGYPEVKAQTEYIETSPGKVEPKETFTAGQVNSQEMIAEAYKLALEMGADAIISFKISNRKGMSRGNVEVDIQELSGFAIKRL